ncbi:MAG: Cytochrome c oxidase assembly protein CtaG [Stygiobacter sp.]|nr:MAG: Cytochrome c oxidase assembly protein CtaG [Stygiobacter sp.]
MPRHRHTMTVAASLGAVAVMIGLVAISVPLYDLFCRVTGYGGTTRVAPAPEGLNGRPIPEGLNGRPIIIRFDASLAKGMPWRFTPEQRQITTHLGEQTLAVYNATNLSEQPVIGTATFNVTPAKAGRYFNKVQCFCFTEQRLEPGQSVDMPVSFFVDPALAEDETTAEITTITLSYTFFPISHRRDRS